MVKLRFSILILLVFPVLAEHRSGSNQWLASAGLGFSASPAVLLISPQLEYPYKQGLYVGPLFQVGIGSSTMFTASGALRYIINNDRKLRAGFELGLGLTAASSKFGDSSVGILVHFGMGMDYWVIPDMAIGTLFRANLAPPVKTFFFSWPMIIGRFII